MELDLLLQGILRSRLGRAGSSHGPSSGPRYRPALGFVVCDLCDVLIISEPQFPHA